MGTRPRWSNDGLQIYYLRYTDAGECCALRRVDAIGENDGQIAELGGFDMQNSYYGIDADGNIFYNHLDRSTDEIWLAAVE
jgi:hypothetical protein